MYLEHVGEMTCERIGDPKLKISIAFLKGGWSKENLNSVQAEIGDYKLFGKWSEGIYIKKIGDDKV